MTPWHQGLKAFQDELKSDENPFSNIDPEYLQWNEGYIYGYFMKEFNLYDRY